MPAEVIQLYATDAHHARARRAGRKMVLWSLVPGSVGVLFLWLAVIVPLRDGEPVTTAGVLFTLVPFGIVVGAILMARSARKTTRRSVGADGLVFAVSSEHVRLADRVIPWSEVASITFRRTAEKNDDATGTAAAAGRRIGTRIAHESGRSFHNIIVTGTNGSTLKFPFGSLLGEAEFEQAQAATRKVAPVRVKRGGNYPDADDIDDILLQPET